MESMLNKNIEQAGSGKGRFGPLILSLLLLGIMLLLDFFFAPALINFIEVTTGIFTTPEILVRAYFFLFLFQLSLAFFFFLFVRPVRGLRQRMILYFLLAEGVILCSIWIFDAPENLFRSEESAMTFFSSAVLTLCAVGAVVNLFILRIQNDPSKVTQVFWGLLSAAFLFAAIDEFFKIHEKLAEITQVPNWGQDLFTVAYAVGAFCVLVIFYKAFRNSLFRRESYFFRLLIAGIMVLGLAMFLDTFDRGFQFLFGRYFDANLLCNSLEELMEFTAACLFCCACFVNVFEADNGRILNQVEGRIKAHRAHRTLKAGFTGFVLLAVVGLLGMKLAYDVPDDGVISEKGYPVTLFADMDDGLKGPDGLLFHPDYGLIVCNEGSGELLVFDRAGRSTVLVNSRSGLVSPEGVAVGTDGIFISDDSKGRLVVYPTASADLVEILSLELESPEGLAVDAQDRLYIADEKLSMVIRKAGDHCEILASSLDGLMTPEEMAFDEEGNLYVTDEAAHSIFKISPEGDTTLFVDGSSGLMSPEGIVVHDERIYVTDALAGLVFRFEKEGTGEVLLRFGKRIRKISGIAFDSRGDLFLVANDLYSQQAYIFKVEFKDEGLPRAYLANMPKKDEAQN